MTWLESTLFIDIYGLPLVIIWLVAGAFFFTLRMGFINIRVFGHAVQVILGKYDTPDEPGEVSHAQALFTALSATVGLFQTILHDAIHPQAVEGGAVGVLVQGIRRGVFSNEAGIDTAPIAHSATRTSEPVREGLVAMLEPFIDTVLICNMTALVCIITGVYQTPNLTGVNMTLAAFSTELAWFPIVLTLAVCLFAFSTIISW